MPSPAGVPSPAPGSTRISIRAADAERVDLAGDFNKWQPVAATRAGNGVWYVDLPLPPGEYRYAFRINGKEWRVPEGVAAADDDFGGKAAWLTVSRRPSR
jgi:1,4-alpha-glucan branching enzyme